MQLLLGLAAFLAPFREVRWLSPLRVFAAAWLLNPLGILPWLMQPLKAVGRVPRFGLTSDSPPRPEEVRPACRISWVLAGDTLHRLQEYAR